jgi:hypothetical protein
MRTKTVLLSAAAVAAGVASLQAQSNVYSLNVVGYVNVTLNAGYNAIVNPLDDGAGNLLTNVIGGGLAATNQFVLPQGTSLLPWNGNGFGNAQTYITSYGWYDGSTENYSTNSIPPGLGMMIQLPPGSPATTITFVGNVLQGTTTNYLSAGYTLTGSTFPVAMPPGVVGDGQPGVTMQMPVIQGDSLVTFNNPGGFYSYTYVGTSYGWYDPNNANLSTNGPTIGVGQAFYMLKQTANPWVQSFSVTP